jgi:transcription elongation factor GreA
MVQYFTKEGLQKLKDELKALKTKDIPETKKLIAEARAFGDLKENAAYHDARDKMAFLMGRAEQLEGAVNEAVIKEKSDENKIELGSLIKIDFGGEIQEYEISAPTAADILKNKISYQSPLGKELMNKKIGDAFKFGPKNIAIKVLEIR